MQTKFFTPKNTGIESVHINAFDVSDPSVFSWRIEPAPPLTLSLGVESVIHVDFEPDEATEHEAEPTIITEEVLTEPISVPLRGRGEAEDCDPCSPVIDVSDDMLSLDALLTCSATETITVRNIGDRPLRITGTNVVNDSLFTCGTFSVPVLGGPVVLAEMESHVIAVTFTATRECFEYFTSDSEENILYILSNDPSTPEVNIPLEGLALCLF